MTPRQQIVAIFMAIVIFLTIFDLVRRRQLKEEYSWLWLLTGVVIIVFAVWYDLLERITHLIGAVSPISTIFFFGIIFLLLVCLQLSVSISGMSNRIKNLTQEIAILKEKLKKDDKG